MATRPEQLYDEDFYAWTRGQARALRRLKATRPNVDLDLPHLIEEVEDLGISQRDAVRRQLRRIIEHCLELEYSPARDPRVGWHESIIHARTEIEDKIMPSIRRGLPRRLPRLWQQARRNALLSLRVNGEHGGRGPADRLSLAPCRPPSPRLVSAQPPRAGALNLDERAAPA